MTDDIRSIVKARLSRLESHCVQLGESASFNWVDDPFRLLFSLARYKFVAKMLSGLDSVLEIGCADGFGSYLVSKRVKRLTAMDIDSELVNSAIKTVGRYSTNISFRCGDICDRGFLQQEAFDGVYLLDVLEHIDPKNEDYFLRSIVNRLKINGTLIIGLPSLESQKYASQLSTMGHINCKTQNDLEILCKRFFHNVYLFGANDEVIHTGHQGMQHYRLALCSSKIF